MVDTKLLFESTFELLDPPAGLRLIIQECMPMIKTFATPLETIVRNLLGNAIKHHDKVDGIISITVKEMSAYYEFSVIDDGPGIEPEYHQQIFDLFKTLNPRDQIEGSGMGLSMIKKILDVQGGSITVMSDGKSGSCFTFIWPKY
jgi:signal transduction histidine kinase